jgi:tetratricopeptide (TPR) repeat protein
LLAANNLVLAGRYDEAVAAYERMTLPSGSLGWSAVHNNLGVTRFNRYMLNPEGVPQAGLSDFERSVALARQTVEPEIEMLAHVNTALLYQQANNRSGAAASCQAALSLNAQSPLPYMCQVRNAFYERDARRQITESAMRDIERWLNQIEQLDPGFVPLHYFRGWWHMNRNDRQAALAAFGRFFQAMQHRACLRADQDRLDNARSFMNSLNR